MNENKIVNFAGYTGSLTLQAVKDAQPSLAEGAGLASRIAYHVNELQKNRAIYPAINGGLLKLPLKVFIDENTPIYPILDGEMGYFVVKTNAKLEVLTDTTVDCILIGGGGSGGAGVSTPLAGGGGGAGGLLSVNAHPLEKTSTPLNITIGSGGKAGAAGAAGGDTSIGTVLTAFGGGKGGSNATPATGGGSGGGAQGATSITSTIGGTGTSPQGNVGGSNEGIVSRPGGSGGGGSNMNTDPEDDTIILGVGVSRIAGDDPNKGTAGGQGYKLGELWTEFSEEISGIVDDETDMIIPLNIPNSLAGGGSGGSTSAVTDPTSGTHGGGTGGYGTTAATGGITNSGGGGGGGLGAASNNGGGTGGSGLCLIRFPLPQGVVRAITHLEAAYADINIQDEAIVEKPVDIDMVAAALAANYVDILKSSAIEQLDDEDAEEIAMEAEMELDEILAVLTAVNEQL